MKTLDRYIVRQFLLNFFILLTVFTLLFTVVNVTLNLDEFIDAGNRRAGEFRGGAWAAMLWAILDYNAPMVVLLYVFFCGLLLAGAMGFTFAGLSRTRELVAMVSSGISMYRIAAPVIVAGCVLSGLSLFNQEFVIPALAPKLVRSASGAGRETVKPFEITYAADGRGALFTASSFDAVRGRLERPSILVREDGIATSRITADSAAWDPELPGWRLEHGVRAPLSSGVAPLDNPGQRAPVPVDIFAPSDLSPQVLLAHRAQLYTRLLSLRDLEKLSENSTINQEQVRQIIHTRFSLLVMNVLVLTLGLPFFLLREPANLLIQGLKAATLCMGAWGGGLIMLQIGADLLNPATAAWLPVVFYLPVSAVYLLFVKT